MHIQGYPKYYVKDGERRAVYYTADARDLKNMGWKPEKEAKEEPKLKEAPAAFMDPFSEAEDLVEEEAGEGETDFDFMTKAELLEYAKEHDIEVRPTQTKTEIVEAIRAENG